MTYNFDEPLVRRNSNSFKWDSTPDAELLPMWVADMDFRTAPAIVEALHTRVDHGAFGYTRVPDSYYEAVTQWFERKHQLHIHPSWIIYTTGVVPAISAIIKAFTQKGDKVLVQTPVYNCFFSSIRNNGCDTLTSPLVYGNNTYTIDFDDLEAKLAQKDVKLMLLCNPHNPAGRVWSRSELTQIGELCIKHNVLVVADEIHCELVMPQHHYTPFASICPKFLKHSITCISASKAFNIAGLQIANIVCANDAMRAKIDRAINDNEVCDVNPFGVIATEVAYNKCEDWLQQLNAYIYQNYLTMVEFCHRHLPQLPITTLEGTYLAWMNISALNIPSKELEERLKSEAKLWISAGTLYGAEGEGFVRWNLACPRTRVNEGLKRFKGFVSSL